MKKENIKIRARQLRQRGKSYSEIKSLVNVSKSTLSLWLRDVPLSDKQKMELFGRERSRHAASKARKKARVELTEKIIHESAQEAYKLINDKLFLTGLMLYWAEGTKRGNEMISFSNSDPNMIKLMMKWFRTICKVKEDKFRIQLHIHNLLNEEEVLSYWQKITGIPRKQFHKLIIKKTSLGHRKNKLYYGTCCIRVYNVNLFRRIMGWKIGALKTFNIQDDYEIPR